MISGKIYYCRLVVIHSIFIHLWKWMVENTYGLHN